eukprot:2404729-Amphidinium_carterae.1
MPAMLVYLQSSGAACHLQQEALHLNKQYVQLGMKIDGQGDWVACAMNATQCKLLRAALHFAHHHLQLEHVMQVIVSNGMGKIPLSIDRFDMITVYAWHSKFPDRQLVLDITT